MLEKFILRWGQTEEPWYLKPTLEGSRVESDAFCLVSQIFSSTPAQGRHEKLLGAGSP